MFIEVEIVGPEPSEGNALTRALAGETPPTPPGRLGLCEVDPRPCNVTAVTLTDVRWASEPALPCR